LRQSKHYIVSQLWNEHKRKILFNEINKNCIDEIIISFHGLANIGTKQEENNKIVQKGRLLFIQASIIEKITYKNILA
jgi:hypothetical protein